MSNTSKPQLNAFMCDHCGIAEPAPFGNETEDLTKAEAEALVNEKFYAAKRYFGERGWYTSVGYDLCPGCRKIEGKEAGYHENGKKPWTVTIPIDKGKA